MPSFRCLLILCCFFYINRLSGQEFFSVTGSPNSGVYAIFSNPAHGVANPYAWHANLGFAGANLNTNYLFLQNASIIDVLRNNDQISIAGSRSELGGDLVLGFNDDNRRKYGAGTAKVLWPSLIWKHKDDVVLGGFAKTTVIGSFYDFPSSLGYFQLADVDNIPTEIDQFSAGYMAYTEIGGHYSTWLHKSQGESSSIGINAKLIIPHEFSYISSTNEVIFNHQDSIYTVEGFEINSRYTFFESNSPVVRVNGLGMGVDLGVMVVDDNRSYGISLLDFGFAYYGGNALSYDIVSDTTVVYNSNGISDPEDIVAIIEDIDAQLDPQLSRQALQKESFFGGLPMALSFQYHRKINANWSIGGQVVQRFPILKNTVKRPNVTSIQAQYQKERLTISVPIALREYNTLSAGIALKYWFLILGTEDLLSFTRQNRLSSTDFFFGIQLYPFAKAKENNGVHCFKF